MVMVDVNGSGVALGLVFGIFIMMLTSLLGFHWRESAFTVFGLQLFGAAVFYFSFPVIAASLG